MLTFGVQYDNRIAELARELQAVRAHIVLVTYEVARGQGHL
jgi:hypothetical protein